MNIVRYRNELIVAFSLFFLFGAYSFKYAQQKSLLQLEEIVSSEITQVKEMASLKKVWGDKEISQKLMKLKELIPSSKVKWHKNGKKLTVNFIELTPSQVNKVITKFLNIAVQIESLKVKKDREKYSVEIKCKW